jgi:hypothetical protein
MGLFSEVLGDANEKLNTELEFTYTPHSARKIAGQLVDGVTAGAKAAVGAGQLMENHRIRQRQVQVSLMGDVISTMTLVGRFVRTIL